VAAFDRRSSSYEQGPLAAWHAAVISTTAQIAIGAAGAPQHVLDIGCGTGQLLRPLAQQLPQAVDLVGVDPAAGMIATGRQWPALDPRIRLSQAAAEALPHPDASFDLVVSTVSFDHWANQGAGLRETARVLRDGARLVLADLCATWAVARHRPRPETGSHTA